MICGKTTSSLSCPYCLIDENKDHRELPKIVSDYIRNIKKELRRHQRTTP